MKSGTIEIIGAILVVFVAMWDPVVSIVISAVLLFVFGILHRGREKRGGSLHNVELEKDKKENLDKIMKVLITRDAELTYEERERGKAATIRNEEVEQMLGVSDSTAERYLEELEDNNEIEQVGEAGRPVYYRLKR